MARPLRVLIAGAGLGGLTLAHGLRNAHIDVAVFERDRHQPDPLHTYRIHINGAGSRALHACLPPPLWATFDALSGCPPRGIRFVTHRLRPLAFIPEPPVADGTDPGATSHPISRAGLRQLLLTGLDDVVSFERRLVRYEQGADGQVTAFFADGTSATGDLLVGADGTGSQVRRQYLPEARVVDTGVTGMAGKFALAEHSGGRLPAAFQTQMTMVIPPRDLGLFAASFIHKPGTTNGQVAGFDLPDHTFWALIGRRNAFPVDGDMRRLGGDVLQQAALRTIAGWHPLLRRLVGESDPATLISVPLHSAESVAPWAPSNVTLLGDAIHAMTPLQGLGGNTALRDAALLCERLVDVQADRAPLPAAIGAYESAMRDYGFEAVRRSQRMAEQVASPSVAGRTVFKAVLRVAEAVPSLKRRLFATQAD